MFVVFEPCCQGACGSSCYSAPEATITLSSLSLSTRYNVDHPTPNALVARRLAALQQTTRHLDPMCRQLRLPAYAAERIFLRKVGGYIFTHRLLMEYFATLEPDAGAN